MSHPAPREPLRLDLEDIRCWLLEQIDGGEEVKGHDSMLSTYINTIDNALAVLSSETVATVEPRGCPTPGACSCPGSIPDAQSIVERATVDTPRTDAATVKMERLDGDFDEVVSAAYARTLERELIDLKQRLLPQFQGRAQRAEHERDALLEQLIIHRTTIANLHGEINKMQNAAPSATGATDAEVDEFVRVARTFSDEHYQNALVAELRRVYHALALRDSAPVEKTAEDHARYEYLRTLNITQYGALWYRAALDGESFDDIVDRHRMKGQPDRPDWAQQLPGAELYDRDHGYDRTGSLNDGQYVCTCAAGRVLHEKTCALKRRPDAQQLSHTTGESNGKD